jgi:nucleotide sugar dehydrogenase
MIGIIGYGMVGKAVEYGFSKTTCIISDPQYNTTTIKDVVDANPEAIFVCVPTPSDETNYALLKRVLTDIKNAQYAGITVVKSTILPQYLEVFDVVYNPEFLSRATSLEDFVNPPYVVIGGTKNQQVLDIYRKYSIVDTTNTFLIDIPTACMVKYTMNSFYALKVTFMNGMYDVAQEMGADWNNATAILAKHPWMGSHHYQVPGTDGERGFGGPCLPKDTKALASTYEMPLLNTVIELNNKYRKNKER